jgi:hypothetical protein
MNFAEYSTQTSHITNTVHMRPAKGFRGRIYNLSATIAKKQNDTWGSAAIVFAKTTVKQVLGVLPLE